MMGFPAIPFRLCDFWAIHSESWSSDELTVTGSLPGGDKAVSTFKRQAAPKGNWLASTLGTGTASPAPVPDISLRIGDNI
jgi:hypothetical protein